MIALPENIGLTVDGLSALLERHNLGTITTLAPIEGGSVNPMLRVNDELVVRFNRRDPHLPKLAWEASIYRRLHANGIDRCPSVLALDTARDCVPYDALILNYVEGVPGDTVWPKLDAPGREHVSEELGRLCGAIHSVPWPAYGEYATLPQSHLRSGRWADIVFAKIVQLYDQVVPLNLVQPHILDALITMLNDGDAIYEAAAPTALTHTDLQLSNVLLRQNGDQWDVAAIIDWEWSIVADPVWEFADLWSKPADPYPLADAFLYGYKERHALPLDFRIRQRLYRLLHYWERLIVCAQHWPDTVDFYRAGVERLIKIR